MPGMFSAVSASGFPAKGVRVTAARKRLAVVIINYRTPGLLIDCLESLEPELDPRRDVALVVDNA